MKRSNYISWDDFFMGVAELASKRSKDPRTQHGACIINENNRIIGVGYNGLPDGCSDDEYSWERAEKHKYVIHAEVNAVLNATKNLENATLYLFSERGLYPCGECAKIIVQSGIRTVVLKYIGENLEERYNGSGLKKLFSTVGGKIRSL